MFTFLNVISGGRLEREILNSLVIIMCACVSVCLSIIVYFQKTGIVCVESNDEDEIVYAMLRSSHCGLALDSNKGT